jgi:Tfp pilus assembly protein FimT
MKKVLLVLMLMLTAGMASAQWHHHGGYCCYRGDYGGGWIAPALVGGVIGYELSRPNTVVVEQQQPSVIVQQPQTVVQAPPVGYHWQEMVDPQTGVRKIVAVPN